MPVSTLRTWFLGLALAIIVPGLNQFFFFRFASIQIDGFAALLLILPLGRAAAAFVPNWTIFGVRLNPGPFTVKEHVLVTVRLLSGIDNYHTLTTFSFSGYGMSSISILPFFEIDFFRLLSVVDLHTRPTLSRSKECTTTKSTTLAVSSFRLASH